MVYLCNCCSSICHMQLCLSVIWNIARRAVADHLLAQAEGNILQHWWLTCYTPLWHRLVIEHCGTLFNIVASLNHWTPPLFWIISLFLTVLNWNFDFHISHFSKTPSLLFLRCTNWFLKEICVRHLWCRFCNMQPDTAKRGYKAFFEVISDLH